VVPLVRIAGITIAGLLLLARPALASDPSKLSASVAEARRLVKTELRYAEAVAVLESALLDPGLSLERRIEAYELLGHAQIAQGQIERAEAAFQSLLEIAPEHQLPAGTSPKIQEAYARVQKRQPHRAPLLGAVTTSVSGQRLSVAVSVRDPARRLAGIDLYFRTEPDAPFAVLAMALEGSIARGQLPEPLRAGNRVDYYLVARDKVGAVLARQAGSEAPLSVVIEMDRQPPPPQAVRGERWFEAWWFWTIVGGVALTGVGAAYLLSRPSSAPSGTLDPIHVP
jgi:tetratricopeptide (TPR) repeat protein